MKEEITDLFKNKGINIKKAEFTTFRFPERNGYGVTIDVTTKDNKKFSTGDPNLFIINDNLLTSGDLIEDIKKYLNKSFIFESIKKKIN